MAEVAVEVVPSVVLPLSKVTGSEDKDTNEKQHPTITVVHEVSASPTPSNTSHTSDDEDLAVQKDDPDVATATATATATGQDDNAQSKADVDLKKDDADPATKEKASMGKDKLERYTDEYVEIIERRLQIVEDELQLRRKADWKEIAKGLGDAGKEKPKDTKELEVDDKAQEVKLQRLEREKLREVKPKMGVAKGSVLFYVPEPKRHGGGECQVLSTGELLDDTEVPYRLAINSHCLLKLLSDKTKITMKSKNMQLRPFKYLIFHEKLIREELQSLKGECASLCQKISPESGADVSTKEAEHGDASTTVDESAAKETDESKKVRERDHLQLLVDFMDTQMTDIFQLRKEIKAGDVDDIYFEDLWHLFTPGQLVFTSTSEYQEDSRRAFRVLHVTGGRSIRDSEGKDSGDTDMQMDVYEELVKKKGTRHMKMACKSSPVLIDCCYIDHDGEWYGPKSTRFIIPEYDGKKKIDSLEIYPAEFDKNRLATEKALLHRGQKFVELSATRHHNYAGRTLQDDEIEASDEDVRCECVIDHSQIYDSDFFFHDEYLARPSDNDLRERTDTVDCGVSECTTCTDIFDDGEIDRKYRKAFIESEAGSRLQEAIKREDADSLDDQSKMLLPARVFGYALADRKWHALHVNRFIERGSDKPFEDLVLDSDHKTLLQALVKNHMRDDTSTANDKNEDRDGERAIQPPSLDLIRGKGRGLIILLHGVPGVGKTSTAESVASQLGRPLFPITCGDLGTDARNVEVNLESYSRLAAKWKCVLLLDEADVFLARRTQGDVQRNGLVSVFLRVLEYYSGILILTTNRVGEFDEAFRSRIHISLYYPRLSQASTEEIWKLNIRRVKESTTLNMSVNDEDIMQFCRDEWEKHKQFPGRRWNGRQIKNAFQTAIALSNWDFYDSKKPKSAAQPTLEAKHFVYVAKTSSGFDNYLDEVHRPSEQGGAYSEMAVTQKIRQDSYNESGSHLNGHEASTPIRRPQHRFVATPKSADVQAPSTPAQSGGENEAKIRQLRSKLKRIDKNKNLSSMDREKMKMDIEIELEELGAESENETEEVREPKEKSPWD